MQPFASLRVAEGTVRATTPHGPLGDLEVLFIRHVPPVGHRIGALPEVDICDHAGVERTVLLQDLWFVKNDASPPSRYTIERQDGFPADTAWAVIANPSRAVAACRMEGAAKYLGTREKAQQWADALNEKFPS